MGRQSSNDEETDAGVFGHSSDDEKTGSSDDEKTGSSDDEETDAGSSDDEETDAGSSDDEETEARCFGQSHDPDSYFRTLVAVEKDNKHQFIRLFNRLSSFYKQAIISRINSYDAPNCLAAILDEEAGGDEVRSIIYSVFYEENNIPLHRAARCTAFGIASLLLDKGFSADLRSDFVSPYVCLNNALPLNVSIDYARFHHWQYSRGLSPIHQIISLCLDLVYTATIRVFARNTKEIKHEFFKYLKQGKVFEVGALLAIASDLIMSSPSKIDGENGSIGFKNIMEMRQFVLAEMSRSLGASNTQLKELKKTLRLLEIFDRVGDKLLAHMPMWDNYTHDLGLGVSLLIEDAAYDEKKEVEYDYHDAVPRAYYTRFPYSIESGDDTSLPYVPYIVKDTTINFSGGQLPNCTRKFSTKVHFPSWLEEGNSHVYVPLPLPTTVKGALTKHVLSKKHASFTRIFAMAVRHLLYR